jgi:hypothetical protein
MERRSDATVNRCNHQPNERHKMKQTRSNRPGVENLECKVLLSAGATPLAEAHPAVAHVARAPVHLIGYMYSGTGTVSPMGGVHGSLNLAQRTVTMSNGAGSVGIQLTQLHKYGPTTVTARAYKILKGTGQFRALHGQGHTSLTAVKIRGRLSVWTESFYP